MPLNTFKIPKREKVEYPPLPEDIYQVELLDITSKQKPMFKKPDVLETVLSFQFTVLDEGELRGRNLWRNNVPAALWSSATHGKNVLWQIMESIIMRELTPLEVDNMDSEFINKLIGYQCRLIIKNNKDEAGKVWNNIDSFLPKKHTMPGLTDEEKDKARVKVKEGQPITDTDLTKNSVSQPAPDDDIPTINLDDDEPEPVKIEEVPF